MLGKTKNKDAPNEEITTEVIKEKKAKKEKPIKKPKKDKKGAKIEQELSDLAKSLGIRVSSPYGYYPEDVDPIIIGLQKTVSDLTKENKMFADKNYELEEANRDALQQITKLKMEMSMIQMDIPSQEDSISAISQMFGDDEDIEVPSSPPRPKIKLKGGGTK